MKPKRILVPVDFSEGARSALHMARGIAAESGALLILLHVGHVQINTSDLMMTSVSAELIVDLSTKVAAAQMQHLERWAAEELPEVMERSLHVREGAAWEQILEQAQESDCDLIVMGTHGRTGLAHAFMGSVTERVIQRATVPVLVTR